MKIRQNLHIHSTHSCDSACATMADIQKEMLKADIKEFGVSDHFHTRYNMCDIESSRNDFLCDKRPKEFHFGIEVTCMAKWECENIAAGKFERILDDPVYGLRYNDFDANADTSPWIDITAEDIKRLGIEYVIGGVHWPLNNKLDRDGLLEDAFKQHLYLIEHPLVDILAHPWDILETMVVWNDWTGVTGKGRFNYDVADLEVFNEIAPLSDKLLEAILKNNKYVELNVPVLTNQHRPLKIRRQMMQLMAQWREAGVKFTIGTDQHSAHHTQNLACFEMLLDAYGFKEENIGYLFD